MASACSSLNVSPLAASTSGVPRGKLSARSFTPGVFPLLTQPSSRSLPRRSFTVQSVIAIPPPNRGAAAPPVPAVLPRTERLPFIFDGVPSLPQNDTEANQQLRERIRAASRMAYAVQFDAAPYTPIQGVPLLTSVPFWEYFSWPYVIERVKYTAASILDTFLLTLDLPAPKTTSAPPKGVPILAERSQALQNLNTFLRTVGAFIFQLPNMTTDHIEKFKDYAGVFFLISKPKSTQQWSSDEFFAHQRLAGCNPVAIKRANAQNLPKFAELRSAFDGELGIEQKIAENTLFYIDYEAELEAEPFPSVRPEEPGQAPPSEEKFFPKPVALFTSDSKRQSLLPLAIYINDKVYSPKHSNPLEWTIAKLCVTVADANLHEMSAHLGRTHFVLQPFGIVTNRELPPQHPVRQLLEPHLRFLLANNALGVRLLINYGGSVDELLAPALEESVAIAAKSVKTWSYQEFLFPKELANRGFSSLGSADVTLSYYPFRDDGALVWEAISNYVANYLQIYYQKPEDITSDFELQAWAQQLASLELGGLKDFPTKITSREQLADILTLVIWTGSAQHCAVNFTQYDYGAYIPSGTFALYNDFEKVLKDVADAKVGGLLGSVFGKSLEQQLLATGILAGPKDTIGQLSIMSFLSAYRYDKLGYEKDHITGNTSFFKDPPAQAVQREFQDALAKAQAIIEERNTQRLADLAPYADYKVLLPENILNSTSI